MKYNEVTFGHYQSVAQNTAIYPRGDIGLAYVSLGLSGEVGEIANKVKKVYRDYTDIPREDLAHELGDVLWYVAAMASELGYSLDDIAQYNMDKLKDRAERGKLRGSGDDR